MAQPGEGDAGAATFFALLQGTPTWLTVPVLQLAALCIDAHMHFAAR